MWIFLNARFGTCPITRTSSEYKQYWQPAGSARKPGRGDKPSSETGSPGGQGEADLTAAVQMPPRDRRASTVACNSINLLIELRFTSISQPAIAQVVQRTFRKHTDRPASPPPMKENRPANRCRLTRLDAAAQPAAHITPRMVAVNALIVHHFSWIQQPPIAWRLRGTSGEHAAVAAGQPGYNLDVGQPENLETLDPNGPGLFVDHSHFVILNNRVGRVSFRFNQGWRRMEQLGTQTAPDGFLRHLLQPETLWHDGARAEKAGQREEPYG